MEFVDITTAAGIAAFIGVIILPIKNILKNKILVNQKWFGIVTLTIVFILCAIVSFIVYAAEMIDNDTSFNALIRSLQACFIAIGGYEGIKQAIELIMPDGENNAA